MASSPDELTRLLLAWGGGDQSALERLTPLVYTELRRLANYYMRHQAPGHTLQATALVNEAFVKLIDARQVGWKDRAHFFAVAAQAMRQILIDHARAHGAGKRGGGAQKIELDEAVAVAQEQAAELLALDEALTELARRDPRKSQVIELRFFGGLSIGEAAEVLQVSEPTVQREWRMAKAWLYRRISGGGSDES